FAGYIGEIWKYLLSQPPKETDRKHKVKNVCGNGLRSNLVPVVKERFGVEKVHEFYGATEGNGGLVNLDNTPGAVGFLFQIFPFLNTCTLVKADPETGDLIRNENGYAIRCKANEVGTVVIPIKTMAEYYGYENNEKESNKKIARNVFKEGDAAFLSGDLLVMDEYHYVYFVDRIGDTFRWKSENVSTTEVENIMSSVVKSAEDVVVYPVPIPEESGNAGMAYIREKTDEKFSIEGLAKALLEELPKYAIPMFIRVGSSLDQTGTFKYQKSALKKENYDFESYDVKDSVYVYDVTKKDYVTLDSEVLDKIKNQEMRF
ncbi:MAG: long-chain-acyl-CoA synthetase, partial [Cyanobacteria bacterium J06649_11]